MGYKVCILAAKRDQTFCVLLEKHLQLEKFELVLSISSADTIIMLLSADLLREFGVQSCRSLQHKHVIPVRAHAVILGGDWHWLKDLQEISGEGNRDEVCLKVASAIRGRLEGMHQLNKYAHLPSRPRRWIGREDELRHVVAVLLAHERPACAILGAAGIGKSALARQALHDPRVKERFQEQRHFVRCDSAPTARDLLARVADALDVPMRAESLRLVRDRLSKSPSLLTLDNLETPLQNDRAETEALLEEWAQIPHLALLVTLRGRAVPSAASSSLILDPMGHDDAQRLFLETARGDFAGDARLQDLLRELDGVPLAIVLMAERANGEQKLDPVWAEWVRRGTSMKNLNALQQSFEMSLASPHIEGPARQTLALLALLPDGLSINDCIRLVGAEEFEAVSPIRKEALLFDDGDRLRMLAPLREYLRRRLPMPDVREKVLSHFYDLARNLGPHVGDPGGREKAQQLAAEIGNLESLIQQELQDQSNGMGEAIQALLALVRFYRFSGQGSLHTFQAAREALRRMGDPLREAECIKGQADITLERVEYGKALELYQAALQLYQQAGDEIGQAWCLLGIGHVARYRCDYHEALQKYAAAQRSFKAAAHEAGLGHLHKAMGHHAMARGDLDQAVQHYKSAIDIFEDREMAGELANCQRSLGGVHRRQGSLLDGETLLDQAREHLASVGDVRGEADCLLELGHIARRDSRGVQAEERYRSAIDLYERAKDRRGLALCRLGLGKLHKLRGAGVAAARCCMEALDQLKDLRARYSEGKVHIELALLADSAEDRLRWAEAAREAWSQLDRPDLMKCVAAAAAAPSPPRS